VVVVGAGRAGTTTAFACILTRVADRIVLVDEIPERARAEALDMVHGLPFVPDAEVRDGGLDS